MELHAYDIWAFVGFIAFVVVFSMIASRKEESSEDYFLAGRKLTWWLIGISLIASNISTEHFVAMSGRGYELGLAIASYEWTAAVAMVLVALFLLPKFLRSGIYTIPEYLEYRYSGTARGLMAFYMMLAYVFVAIAAVLYSGAIGLDAIFGDRVKQYVAESGLLARIDLTAMLGEHWFRVLAVWAIGIVAGIYTVYGGLKAVVWADLFNGGGLILGGVLVTVLGFMALGAKAALEAGAAADPQVAAANGAATDEDAGDRSRNAEDQRGGAGGQTDLAWHEKLTLGVNSFFTKPTTSEKLTTVKPWDHDEMPWVAVFLGGLWLPQLFYWGLNQFITQRTLGARSVSQGQKGVLFAACLKLLIPFIIIFPGIMAVELFAAEIGTDADAAYPTMIRHILPAGLRGLMLAALFGAIMSSLDSMLNSASTIFTMDLFKRYCKQDASNRLLVTIGRAMTALFVIVGCLWAPLVSQIGGGSVFKYIQMVWGFITPGVVAAFLFGIFVRRTPANAAVGAMLLGIPIYGWCRWAMPDVAFLHHMAITFIALAVYMTALTIVMPLRSAGNAESDEPAYHRGLLARWLAPLATALIGGAVFAMPLHRASEVVCESFSKPAEAAAQAEPKGNTEIGEALAAATDQEGDAEAGIPLHCWTSSAVVLVYMALVIFFMRMPVPMLKRPEIETEEGKKTAAGLVWLRRTGIVAATTAAAAVLALHVYMFCTWIAPMVTTKGRWERTLEDLLGFKMLFQPTSEIAYEITFDAFLVPVVVAAASVVAFLMAVAVIRRMPAAKIEMPVTTKIDLAPSPMVKVWGCTIVLATVVLYYLFF